MALTPSTVQAFRAAGTQQAGTYTLIDGVVGKTIVLISYNIKYSGGTITLQDSSGLVFNTLVTDKTIPSNNYISGGFLALTSGAGLQAILSAPTTFDACFIGFAY